MSTRLTKLKIINQYNSVGNREIPTLLMHCYKSGLESKSGLKFSLPDLVGLKQLFRLDSDFIWPCNVRDSLYVNSMLSSEINYYIMYHETL